MPHDHAHAPKPLAVTDLTKAFRWGVGMNTAYVVIEAFAGFWTGSLALLADAAHNLTDVAGLLIAWGAAALAVRAGTARFTWGFGRATLLAALANGVAILVGSGAVIWEAVSRFSAPVQIDGGWVIAVALVGVAVNTGTALFFIGHDKDLNARGAFLHMAADAAVSVAVVLGALGMMITGWLWIDPMIAITVSVVIAITAAGLISKAGAALMDAAPDTPEIDKIEGILASQDGVSDVHDLHIWQISSTRTALSVHLVYSGADVDGLIGTLTTELARHFGIDHVTIQTERTRCGGAACLGSIAD